MCLYWMAGVPLCTQSSCSSGRSNSGSSTNLFIFNQCTFRLPHLAWSLTWLAAWPATFVVCPLSACHWNIYELRPSIERYFGPGWRTVAKSTLTQLAVARTEPPSWLAGCMASRFAASESQEINFPSNSLILSAKAQKGNQTCT